MNKRVTLSDVASEAGVSVATASAVLSGKGTGNIRVSDARKAEIVRAASNLGYVPNTAAQSLKAGGDNHIIAVFTYENIFPVDARSEYYLFFSGIQQEAEREGYDILILNNWGQGKSRSSRIRLASGAIMIGINRDDDHITSLVRQGFPLLFVGRRKIGDGLRVNCVRFCYEKAVEGIVDAVSRCSDGRLCYVSSLLSQAEPTEEKSFFLHRLCKERGIDIVDITISDTATEESIDAILSVGVVVFDRLFIADAFADELSKRGAVIGRNLFGAILEDDWTGTHEAWTRWENKRLELGALSAKNLIAYLSGCKVEDNSLDLQILESKSTMGW